MSYSQKEDAIWCDSDRKDLNIEHKFISMGGRENHDERNNTMALVPLWVFRSTCRLAESGSDKWQEM